MAPKFPRQPPDARILKMREYEERNRWLCENVKSNMYRDTVVNWENKTNETIRRKLIKQRFEALEDSAKAALGMRRAMLKTKLVGEEEMLQAELASQKESLEVRREKLERRARELREQREAERQAFAEEALYKRWRENCDGIRLQDSKAVVEETTRLLQQQVEERKKIKELEKEENSGFDAMMDFEIMKQQQKYEAAKRVHRERENEALRVLNEQMDLQRQYAAEVVEERKREIVKMKDEWQRQDEEALKHAESLKQQASRTRDELIAFNEAKAEERRIIEEKERELDTRIVAEAMARAQMEEDREAEEKYRAKEEARTYRHHLEMLMLKEQESEAERDAMIKAEEERAWARRDAQLQKEDDARKKLWNEVTNERDIQLRRKAAIKQRAIEDRHVERDFMSQEISRLEKMEGEYANEQKAARIKHRMDIEAQIAAREREKLLEKMRAAEERAAFQNSEKIYQGMLDKDVTRGPPLRHFGIKSANWYT